MVVLLLLLGEVVARVLLTSPSGQDFDADLGWVWRPGATIFNNSEGGAPIVINGAGLNDDELEPKGKRFRILGFGNSFMEAIQVPREENYTSIVERLVPGIDFVNLARSAMGPAHYPIVLERFGSKLDPDLLIVSVGEGDVLSLLSSDVSVERDAGGIQRIALSLNDKDQLKGAFGPILDNSALATYLMRRLKPVILESVAEFKRVFGPAEAEARLMAPPDDKAGRFEAADRLAFILRRMRAAGPVLVVYVPFLEYGPHRHAEAVAAWETEAYTLAAKRAGVPLLDCGPALIDVYARTGQPPHGFPNKRVGVGHLNAAGHAAVAETIAGWLEEHVSVERREVRP